MKITITFTINDRAAIIIKKIYQNRIRVFILLAVMLSSTLVYTASDKIEPFETFKEGTTVFADPVNSYFKTLYDKVNEINNIDVENLKSQLSNGTTDSFGDPIGTILNKYNNDYIEINDMIKQLQAGDVPKGIIAMWPNSTPPTNWVLCDSDGNAMDPKIPDLSDKFIVGASKDAGDVSSVPAGVLDYPDKTYKIGDSEITPQHLHNIDHEHLGFSTANQRTVNCNDSAGCLMIPDVHNHQWIEFGSFYWRSNIEDASDVNINIGDDIVLDLGGGIFPFLVPTGTASYYTTGVSDINHEINVQKENGFESTGAATEPPYKSLYYIYKYQ